MLKRLLPPRLVGEVPNSSSLSPFQGLFTNEGGIVCSLTFWKLCGNAQDLMLTHLAGQIASQLSEHLLKSFDQHR
jgi:hypothetical protein